MGRIVELVTTRQATGRRTLGFFAGVRAVFRGGWLVFSDAELRKLTAIPIALTGLVYVALITIGVLFSDEALGLLWSQPETTWLIPVWYLAWLAGMASFFLVAALLLTTVAEAVGGPFYERMATRILGHYGVQLTASGFVDGTILDILRSLLFVLPAAFFAVLGLLPGIGLPFTLLGGMFAWLGFGSGAINPALLVTGHKFGARLSYVRQHFFTILGLGSVVALSMTVPFLPLISIPCGIAGATELYGRAEH